MREGRRERVKKTGSKYYKYCPECGRFLGERNYLLDDGQIDTIKCGNCRGLVSPIIRQVI